MERLFLSGLGIARVLICLAGPRFKSGLPGLWLKWVLGKNLLILGCSPPQSVLLTRHFPFLWRERLPFLLGTGRRQDVLRRSRRFFPFFLDCVNI